MASSWWALVFLVMDRIKLVPASFFAGDLVQIISLKPQKNASAEVAELVSLFNNSCGYVTMRHVNKKMNRIECVVESVYDGAQRLRIKEKYLRLIPRIMLHDSIGLDSMATFDYWWNVSMEPDQFTFSLLQTAKKMLTNKHRSHKMCMLEPLIAAHFPFYGLLESSIRKTGTNLSFSDISGALSLMPKAILKRVLHAVRQSVNNRKCYARVLDKIEKHWIRIQSRCETEDDFDDRNQRNLMVAFRTLDQESVDLLLHQMWLELKAVLDEFNADMVHMHGTNNLCELFSMDIVRNYREIVRDKRRTFNVLIQNVIDKSCTAVVTRGFVMDLLMKDPKYQKSIPLIESIVQIYQVPNNENILERQSLKEIFKSVVKDNLHKYLIIWGISSVCVYLWRIYIGEFD